MRDQQIWLLLSAALFSISSAAGSAGAQTVSKSPESQAYGGVGFTQLSETIWMHTSYKTFPNSGPFPSNGLVVFDGPNAVLIDSAWNDSQTEIILDWAENAGHPVNMAIFTHAHEDRMGGAGAIRHRGITTYANRLTNELATGNGLNGAEHDVYFPENNSSVTIGPATLYYPGAGHSADNIVVHFAGEKILFGGCIIRSGSSRSLGNTDDADIATWGAAVEAVRLKFPDTAIVVPGHGKPGNLGLLESTIRLSDAASSEN